MKRLKVYKSLGTALSLGWDRDDVQNVRMVHVFAQFEPGEPVTLEGHPWPCSVCEHHGFTSKDFESQVEDALAEFYGRPELPMLKPLVETVCPECQKKVSFGEAISNGEKLYGVVHEVPICEVFCCTEPGDYMVKCGVTYDEKGFRRLVPSN